MVMKKDIMFSLHISDLNYPACQKDFVLIKKNKIT